MWTLLAGAGAVGLVLWLVSRAGESEGEYNAEPAELQEQEEALSFDFATIYRIIGTVGERSSGYGALNKNDAGRGVSFGLVQHNQGGGNLGRMLKVWRSTDPAGFARVWGALGDDLVAKLTDPSDAVRLSLNLAVEPYLSRWALAGNEQGCKDAQAYTARTTYLSPRILEAAEKKGLRGTVSIGLVFDRSVNQGPGAALDCLGQVEALPTEGQEAARIDFSNACIARLLPRYPDQAAAVERRLARVDAALKAAVPAGEV